MALTLTKAGKALLQKIQVGEIEAIDFTGIAVGSGSWNAEDINENISALKEMRIKSGLSNKETEVRDNETIAIITATINNKNIEQAFYVYEVGLYAMDGEEEVLYSFDITPSNEVAQAVVQANTVPQYIPVVLDTALSSIDKVNIKITADVGFVSADQFETYKQDIKRQLDRKQPAGSYATTDALTSSLDNKSDKNHNHDEEYLKQTNAAELFAEKSHNHDDTYLKIIDAAKGYAPKDHNHDNDYSKINHIHSNYAASSHSHSDYSLTSHNHDSVYAKIVNTATKPIVTTTSSGTWIEMPLNNGKSLLIGVSKKDSKNPDGLTLMFNMLPPKKVQRNTVRISAYAETNGSALTVTSYGYVEQYNNILVIGSDGNSITSGSGIEFVLCFEAITL